MSEVPGRTDPERQFRAQLRPVLRNLERALDDLMENFWEEPLRRHAREVASALLEGCKAYGYLELASVTRAILSLLELEMDVVLTLKEPLQEKFTELVGLSKELAEMLAA